MRPFVLVALVAALCLGSLVCSSPASGQIVARPLSVVERAREEARRGGNLRELNALNARRRARGQPEEDELLPAPRHIVLTPDGEQEIYQPDRENRIRVPARRSAAAAAAIAARGGYAPASNRAAASEPPIRLTRPKKGSFSVRGRPRAFVPEHNGGVRPPTPTNPNAVKVRRNKRKAVAARAAAEHGHDAANGAHPAHVNSGPVPTGPVSDAAQHMPAHLAVADPAPHSVDPAHPSAPRTDSYSSDPSNLPTNEDGRLFNESFFSEDQLNALARIDGGEHQRRAEGYFATVVDAIIDPHSTIARPTNDSARGVMIVVLVPIFLLFAAFCAYMIYIYHKRTILEEKQAAAAANESINARRIKKGVIGGGVGGRAAGVPGGVPDPDGVQSDIARKKAAAHAAAGGRQKPAGADDEGDWEVAFDDDDDL